jgi:hypothetical protein
MYGCRDFALPIDWRRLPISGAGHDSLQSVTSGDLRLTTTVCELARCGHPGDRARGRSIRLEHFEARTVDRLEG